MTTRVSLPRFRFVLGPVTAHRDYYVCVEFSVIQCLMITASKQHVFTLIIISLRPWIDWFVYRFYLPRGPLSVEKVINSATGEKSVVQRWWTQKSKGANKGTTKQAKDLDREGLGRTLAGVPNPWGAILEISCLQWAFRWVRFSIHLSTDIPYAETRH